MRMLLLLLPRRVLDDFFEYINGIFFMHRDKGARNRVVCCAVMRLHINVIVIILAVLVVIF